MESFKVTKNEEGRRQAVFTGALLAAGAVLGVLAALWLFDGGTIERGGVHEHRPTATVRESAVNGSAATAANEPAVQQHAVTRTRRAERRTEMQPGQADAENEPEIKAGEYIEALRAAGETGGIAAFNPPGTDPIKRGIIVPDDYELPAGYARRYQTTDDGKQLPPILMFSPDFEFLDANGKPVPLPDDLIVPPDMAPKDLPIRMLDPGQTAGR